MSAKKVFDSTKGNDIWAFALVHPIPEEIAHITSTPVPKQIHTVLTQYQDVFRDPQTLPPQRSYDHAIPLVPGSVPINSRPYHYSSEHKTEIEKQVKQLLQSGLITQSHSPFASPVLLVKKKDGS